MIVTPALLEQKNEALKTELLLLSPHFSRFQIDIADNTLVPNTTAQIKELVDSAFFNIVSDIIFDFHLMVSDPIKHVEVIKTLPKKRVGVVLIHQSVFPPYQLLPTTYPLLRFGLVLGPTDQVAIIDEELMKNLPAIQVMTVKPGFQGSPFIEDALIKIEQLRKRGYKGEILIDGAVNNKTLPIILSKEYKPDVLGIGSFLTKAKPNQLKKRIELLKLTLSTE
jgi:pentose-5-phosphate-3-epimerase